MNNDNTQKNWTELKGKIKAKWAKLNETDVESFKDNLNLISSKIQTAYGLTKDKAEQEYADFRKTLEKKPTESEKSKPN